MRQTPTHRSAFVLVATLIGGLYGISNSAHGMGATVDPPLAPIGPQLQDDDILWRWDNGLAWRTPDYEFTGSIGGEFVATWDFGGADDDRDQLRLEQARLRIEGNLYQSISYRARIEFAGEEVTFRDLYLQLDEVFLGANLLIGNHREPFGLEQLTDLHATSFTDRAAFSLAPGWGTGAMFHGDFAGDGGEGVWALGFFGPDTTGGNTSEFEGEGNLTGRLAYAFRDVASEEDLLHLGLGFSSRGTDAPGAGRGTLLGAELAYVSGPFSGQAEYHDLSDDDGGLGGDATSWYAQLGYFLTDDSRRYAGGRFLVPVPRSKWTGFGQQGSGAYELAARFSSRDDGGASDDEQAELGFNWYLNPNASVSVTVGSRELDGGDTEELLGLRSVLLF